MLQRILASKCQSMRLIATSTTIDSQEIEKFQQFTAEWWDEFGPMKPLHSMNKLRIPFVRDGLVNSSAIDSKQVNTPLPLRGVSVLDVGCGGGILSEALARLGGDVTGIDANTDIINLAKSHAQSNKLNITYITSTIEEHASDNLEKYDSIVASEILEHVTRKEKFLESCINCLKPFGSIFITTINKTNLANFAGIFLSENVLNLLPKGTHQYEKFIEPHKLQRILEDCNCRTHLVHGMFYNIFSNTWHWCSNTSINYALHAIKLKTET